MDGAHNGTEEQDQSITSKQERELESCRREIARLKDLVIRLSELCHSECHPKR